MSLVDRLLRTASAMVALGLTSSFALPAQAATVTWSGSNTATWSTASTNWNGSSVLTPWDSTNGPNDIAAFTTSTTSAAPSISGTVYANGITFSSTGSVSGGTLDLAGVSPTVTVNSTGGTISSVLAGSAGLTKAGAGVLTLTGSEIYTGGTTISAGTLQVGLGAVGSLPAGGAVANSATLSFNRTDSPTFSGNISGNGSVFQIGSGTLTLSGSNGYTGGTTLSAGYTVFSGANSLPSSGLINILKPAALQISGPYSTVSGFLPSIATASSGAVALTASDSEPLNLALYSTLSFGAAPGVTATYSGSFTPATNYYLGGGGGTLYFQPSNGPVLTGAGSTLTVGNGGGGTVVLAQSSSYTGSTTINSGATLQIGVGGSGGANGAISSASAITDNGTLVFNRGDTVTQGTDFSSGGIAGTGGLTQSGSGTLVLNAANSYTGPTLVNGGGVVNIAGSASNSGGGNLIVGSASNGVLNITSTGTVTFNGNVTVGNASGISAAINQAAGTFNALNNTGYIEVGQGGYGVYNMTGGTLNTTSASGISIGAKSGVGGIGILNQSGGLITGTRYIAAAGNGGTNVGEINLTGGKMNGPSSYYYIIGNSNAGATGILNIGTEAGGNAMMVSNNGSGIVLDDQTSGPGPTAIANLSSGTIQLNSGVIQHTGSVGAGIVNFDGGTISASTALTLVNNTPTGVYVYKNGASFNMLASSGTVSANLLQALGNGVYLSSGAGSVSVASGGGNGYIGTPLVGVTGGSGTGAMAIASIAGGSISGITITNPGQGYVAGDVLTFSFSGGGFSSAATSYQYTLTANDVAANVGGVSKSGAGTLYLTGAETYAGPTQVSAGTLALGPSATLASTAYNVASGAVFTVPSTVTLPSAASVSTSGAVVFNSTAQTVNSLNGASTGVVNLNATALAVSNGGSFAGSILDNATGGSLLVGGGLLTLGGSSSFTGGTTISAGTLQIGAGGSTGSLGGSAIADNSFLAFNRSDTAAATALTVPGNIIGSGAMALNGTGAVTFTGNNYYTGKTFVNAGALIVNGTHTGGDAYTVAAGATLAGAGMISGTNTITLNHGADIAPGSNVTTGSVGTLTLPNLTAAGGGAAYFDLSNSVNGSNDLVVVNGELALNGSTTVVVNPTNSVLANGDYPLFDYSSLNYSSSATSLVLAPGAISPRQKAYFDYGTTTFGVVSLDISGGVNLNLTWVGGAHAGVSNTWNQNSTTNTAWSGGNYFATGDIVTFNATSANTTVTVSGAVSPSSLTVIGASPYTFIGGGSIYGGTSLVVQGPASLTIANSGGNSYTGGTFVQGGSIVLGTSNGLPQTGTLTLGSSAGNGLFDMAGNSQTVGGLATDPNAAAGSQFIGNSAASTTSTLTFNSAGASTFSGNIQDGVNGAGGQVALTVAAGQLTLGGSNAYTGVTTIASAGTLQLGSPTALYAGAATNNLVANGLFDLNGSAANVNALSGSGTIGDSTYTSPLLTFGNNNANSTFSGSIGVSVGIPAPALNKTGGGMVVFSGTNNASIVTVSQGTLQATTPAALGAGTYAVNSGSLYLNYAAAAAPAWANISGSGTLELNSAQPENASANWGTIGLTSGFTGTVQLDNGRFNGTPANLGGATNVVINSSGTASGGQFLAYDGSTALNQYTFPQNFYLNGFGWGEGGEQYGALRISGMNATFAGNITLTGTTGIFEQPNHPSQITVSGNISGAYPLAVNVGGNVSYVFTLSGSNTYTGPTTIGGTVDLANSAALLNSTLVTGGGAIEFDVAAGGAFTFGGLSGAAAIVLNDTGSNAVALSVGNNNSSNTYSGAMSGSGSLAKIGTGLLLLSGTNSYLGTTTIGGGTLQLGNGAIGNDGVLATSGMTNNAALVYNLVAAQTINYAISGSGSLVQNGPGNVTLSGSNTFSGTTAVNAGALIIAGTHAGGSAYTVAAGATLAGAGTISGTNSVSLAAGANIAPGNNAATGNVGTLAVPSLSLAGSGTAYFDFSNSTTGSNDLIQVNGALSLGNSTTVVIVPYNGSLGSGAYRLFDYTGSLSYASSATSLLLAPGALTSRQAAHFDYGSTTPGVVSLDVTGVPLNDIWVGGTQGGFTNAWNQNATANTVWSGGNYFATGDIATFNATSANTTVSVSGTVTPTSVTVSGSRTYTFTGPGQITGEGALYVTGSGSLIVANSGGNSYAGGTYIQSGIMTLGGNNVLPVAGTLTLGSAGGNGVFNLAGYSQQVGALSTDGSSIAANQIIGNSVTSSTSTVTVNAGIAASTFAGTIQDGIRGSGGQMALTVAGGLLNLSGSNTYSGVTNVTAGTLQLGSATALYAGAATNNLVANGTFDLNGNNASVNGLNDLIGSGTIVNSSTNAATLTVGNNNATTGVFSGVLQGSTLNLNKTGSGTQTILGTNNAAATTVSQGVLQFGNGAVNGAVGTGTYTINSGASLYMNCAQAAPPTWANISGSGTLELNSSNPVAGVSSGTASTYWGTLNLPSTFTGMLQVDNGRVDSNASNGYGLGGASNVAIGNGAQFLAVGSGLGSAVSYPQNFYINGYGWGESTPPGPTFYLQEGALRASNVNATFTGNIVLTGSTGIFTQYNHATEMTISGNISGAYPLLICDDYTAYPITLSGSNTYTGPTTIGDGTVDLANSAALLNTTLLTGAGGPRPAVGTITFDALVGGSFTFGGLSGSGAITLNDTAGNPVLLSVGNNGQATTYSGTLGGSGTLSVIGGASLTLTGTDNTYTGGTWVENGTLIANNPGAIDANGGANLYVGSAANMFGGVIPASAGEAAAAPAVAPVPEPGTLALLAGLLGSLSVYRRLRRTYPSRSAG
jgi:fibronectin-binding autotransporter adhesin